MSRSRRKTPVHGIGKGSEKLAKRWWNRLFRRDTKRALERDAEGALPMNIHKHTELWDGPKDGKMHLDLNDPSQRKLMRK